MPKGAGCTGDPVKDAATPGCLTAPQILKLQGWIAYGQPKT